MDLTRFREVWRSILGRSGLSERELARRAGLSVNEVRGMVLPRKSTEVSDRVLDRLDQVAAQLPEDERSDLHRLVAEVRAGECGKVISLMQCRIEELEAQLKSRGGTPVYAILMMPGFLS